MEKIRTIQYFTEEYLERCEGSKTEEILKFLDDYRALFANQSSREPA